MVVHKLRLQRGWSQEQLAALAGLSVRTVQRIESGQAASTETLKALAAVFEVDFRSLQLEADMPAEPKPAAAAVTATASAPVAPRANAAPIASALPDAFPAEVDAAAAAAADAPAAPTGAARPGRVALAADEALALRQVRRVRGFYVHLAQYVVVITGLALLNLWTRPHSLWALYVAFGWGLGLFAHALRTFDWIPFLGPDWERRQVEKRIGRQL